MHRHMPEETQLAKLFTRPRQIWFYIIGLVALSLVRKWLLSKSPERPPHFSSRDRRTPAKASNRRQNAAYQSNSRPASRPAQSGGEGRKWRPHARTGNHNKPETESEPVGAATECEMGPQWNFDGHRRWKWMHDGTTPNGWIEFGIEGVLRTSLSNDGRGQWKLQTSPLGIVEMVISFGTCHHHVSLLPQVAGQSPMFKVRKRVMKSGKPLRKGQSGTDTRGFLEIER